ncbi:uncharacterized protein A1O9_03431 [Exophiala aquamarina CBS 119918]|uniref:Zn(2)-C6 fungal-type domain-containing protein n=1 Tax=Exophiala aquamarina CBS 119918 TaxID=1182545 RepID=A0A072Q1V3_9EURO|nr:uncharacterized protein A1O9_03431 [Exophiala aquamarina CBS 119918]KEF61860.1 hypothetical protein A1O9_03431 [Exophiala aquamarina CBS 119918]
MPRRPHKKSRHGCSECKRRHIKCDEHHPTCVNCKTASLRCAFSSDDSPRSTATSISAVVDSGISETSTPVMTRPDIIQDHNVAGPLDTTAANAESPLNMDHLELLHHYCTATYQTFASEDELQRVWKVVVVRMGVSFPPLMYELLSIAALHLAHTRPQNAAWYHRKSIELQTQALSTFTAQRNVDESNCGPVLVFASLLGLHMLCDPDGTQDSDFRSNQYLNHVIRTVGLLRGVKGLTFANWEQQLRQTDLKPLLQVQQPAKPYDIPQPCTDLAMIAHHSDLSSEASAAYSRAIERLQWAFCVSRTDSQRHSTSNWLLAWPIQLDEEYLDLLSRRKPEALIILAYFGALMVDYEDCWAVGDKGLVLIREISEQLDPRWERWMEWPVSLLPTEGG